MLDLRRLSLPVAALATLLLALPAAAGATSVSQLPGAAGCVGAKGCTKGAGVRADTSAAAVAPDGRSLYAVVNDGEWGALLSFARNPRTGALTQVKGAQGCISSTGRPNSTFSGPKGCTAQPSVARASAVAVSPNGRTVYTLGSDVTSETLDVWSRNPSTSVLTHEECWTSGGGQGCQPAPFVDPADMALSPDGDTLAIGGGSLSTMTVQADGTLAAGTCSLTFTRDTAGPQPGCATATAYSSTLSITALRGATTGSSTTVLALVNDFNDPDGTGKAQLASFTVDATTGAIAPAGCLGDPAAAGQACGPWTAFGEPGALGVAPDGSGAYYAGSDFTVTNDESGRGFVAASAITAAAATPALAQLPGGAGCILYSGANPAGPCTPAPAALASAYTSAAAVGVAPGGATALAGFGGVPKGDKTPGAVALLQRDPATQALTPVPGSGGCLVTGAQAKAAGCAPARNLGAISAVAFSADGRNAYVLSNLGIAVLRLRA